MKLKINPTRIIVSFIFASLFVGAALFGICYHMFLFETWDWRQITIIVFYVVSTIGFLLFALLSNYYILERKYVEVHRFKKVLVYSFSDIIYIEEEKSKKEKVIHFYTRQGHTRYLTFDQKGLLYKAMLEKCQNRLTKEEFYTKYPNVKF